MAIEIEGLNPSQAEAVQTVNGRVLILAGAGSGKTRVLTFRMAYLIKHLKVSPKAILGLTFTNKAAAEMRQRMGSLIDSSLAKQVTLCTFHSFCMSVLRQEIHRLGYTPVFSLYNEQDVQRLLKMIAKDILEHDGEIPSLAQAAQAISLAQNRGLKSHEIQNTGSQWHDQFVADLYTRLQESMRAYNAVDFDRLLTLTVELFETFPDVLESYQDRFRYIMIDEYQDTNPIQYKLSMLLSKKYGNLCVVGDDDQSIYGWRGAEVRNILDFDQAAVIKLEQNYRSTNRILKGANAVISHNRHRFAKVLWSNRGEGEPILLFHAPTEADEAESIVARIAKLKTDMSLHWRDFAILYRSNALSRQLEMALMKHTWQEHGEWNRGIPYEVYGGLEFYERREVKDLFAYLRVIVNPLDQEALLRIINHPRRGIGEGALDAMTSYNRQKKIPLWDVLTHLDNLEDVKAKVSHKACQGIKSFINLIDEAKNRFSKPLNEGMEWLLEAIQYRKAINEEVKSGKMQEFKWENVEELVSSMADFVEKSQLLHGKPPTLHDFITSMPLESAWERSHKKKNQTNNKVHLMTFHSAKGLEFPVCFLAGMEDHIIPHEKSLKETGIEEERRLMYVAMTRAMNRLIISMARNRKKMGKDYETKPSRFLYEIPKELMKIVPWHEI